MIKLRILEGHSPCSTAFGGFWLLSGTSVHSAATATTTLATRLSAAPDAADWMAREAQAVAS